MSVTQQGVDLSDHARFIVGGLPDPADPGAQRLHTGQFDVVVVASASPPEGAEILVEGRQRFTPLTAMQIAENALPPSRRGSGISRT